MDPNDVEPSSAFPEEEKLTEGIDEDSNWFGKNLEDESDTTEHEIEGSKSAEEMMETDSQSELLAKKDELTELKDIDKKHDISNELKEMFDEKSSDAEELQESSLVKHSLDTEITKEDKLKDIVPDDILGKDDSFDGLDSDDLHQGLKVHLDYEKSKELINSLPDAGAELPEDADSLPEENQTDAEVGKSLDDLSFEGKSSAELLDNLTKDIGAKEIDEIMDQTLPEEEDVDNKEVRELEETSSNLVEEALPTDETEVEEVEEGDAIKDEAESEEVVNQVDKIEITKDNMMVEFAHDDDQVLIQINTDQNQPSEEQTLKSDSVVMETSDGQTIVFSTNEATEKAVEEKDMVSKVEGGAEFLEAVSGKLEDVLVPTTDSEQIEETKTTEIVEETVESPAVETKEEPPKEESPKCCVATCKSGKSTLRTTFRYFKPPINKMLYKKWEYIFSQARQTLTPDSLICELHFRTGLIYKKGVDKSGKLTYALREGALPKLSPTGIMRLPGPGSSVPSPSTTVQVVKKTESPSVKPVLAKSPSLSSPQRTLSKKILQKPVKTVVSKVTNEVTDIGFLYKNPELVQAAQDELNTLDVLVCGECHSVFHILELFQAHKMAANCSGESNFKGNPSEPKPQVWAFLLWKSAQAKVADVESSWRLYQRWCKMDENVRSSWIAAGQFLQEGNAISSLKIVEDAPPPAKRPGRPPLRYRDSEDEEYVTVSKVKKQPKTPVKSVTPVQNEDSDFGGGGDASNFSEPEPMEVEESNVSGIEDRNEVDETLEKLKSQKPEMLTTEVEIKQEVDSEDEHGENKENARGKSNKESDEVQNCSKCLKLISNLRAAIVCTAGCYGYFHVECTRLKTLRKLVQMGKDRRTNWKCDSCLVLPIPNSRLTEPGEAHNCGKCDEPIVDLRKQIVCLTGCRKHYHVGCTQVREENIKKNKEKGSEWKCDSCRDPNPQDPVFDETHCNECRKEIEDLKCAIFCTYCSKTYHVPCTRLKTVSYMRKMNKEKRKEWKCDSCVKIYVRVYESKSTTPQKPKEPSVQKPSVQKPKEAGAGGEEEYVVEKIVSRRYNIKKKHFEYLLKWEGYPPEQNTWEPAENLGTCQHLLKAFEEALAKQQAAKQASANRAAGVVTKDSDAKIKPPFVKGKKDPPTPATPAVDPSTGRPQRSSKKKAMDQVKFWCGSITKPSEYDNIGIKRRASDDSDFENDDEEVVVKRVKLEIESDEDTSRDSAVKRFPTTPAPRGRGRPTGSGTPRLAVLGTGTKTPVNGAKQSNLAAALGLESDDEDMGDSGPVSPPVSPKKSPALANKVSAVSPQHKVLVASAKGVMRVSAKQVPNLSSGVFVMSSKPSGNKSPGTPEKPGIVKKKLVVPVKQVSPQKPAVGGGVVVLQKSEVGVTPKGIIKKTVVPAAAGDGAKPLPARPPGVIKPMKPGTAPRPLGMLKPVSTSPGAVARPPPLSVQKPLGVAAGTPKTLGQRPRLTPPLRGRGGLTSGLIRRDSLQVTPQQRLLIAKKKAESDEAVAKLAGKPSITVTPSRKPPLGIGTPGENKILMPIRSTNKPLQHPMLARGRGRGGFRGRGRGASLGHLLNRQVQQETVTAVENVKESKLVESDSLLMEFQEPSDSEESDAGLDDPFPKLEELPPVEPLSPPRPISLCPLTGKVLCKAEGEKTPEPTPPPSPKPPTPPPTKQEEPEETHILPDDPETAEAEQERQESVTTPVVLQMSPSPPRPTTTTIVKDGMICKVEMSPGGTTGTLVEAVPANTAPQNVTEGTVTIKKHSSRSRGLKGPQLSVMPSTSSTSLGTITVPARKLYHEEMAVAEAEDDDMVTITGEDGIVYQVSNSELAGNTLLVSGEDGQQQCVYVTTDAEGNEDGSTILTLDSAYADAVAQLGTDQVNILSTGDGEQFYIKEGDDGEQQLVEGEQLMALEGVEGVEGMEGGDDQGGQVVAQLVEAGEPAPGGSRRVVLLLPDGNLMMTEVDEEQYAALDLDK